MPSSDIVNAYLTAFYSGDFETAKGFVADDFDFKGPFIQVTGRERYFTAAARLAAIVRGHSLLRQWHDGDEVSSIYDMQFETPAGKGALYASEWSQVADDKIVRGRLVFDTAAFRALVPMQ